MKQGIHPEYREVAFLDISVNQTFIISSAVQTKETIDIDGKTIPFQGRYLFCQPPFYTGAQTRIVEAGRVEKFRAKFAAKTKAVNEAAAKQRPPSNWCRAVSLVFQGAVFNCPF